MLKLFLLRHAKSDWNICDENDFERDVSQLGLKKTNALGKYIKANKLDVDQILCSPSIRTKKTLEIILNYLNSNPDIEFIDELYHISNIEILEVIKKHAQKKTVMVISHEPKLSSSIQDFSTETKNQFFINSQEKFPTSALFQLIFNTNKWNKVSKYNSKIINFVRPKDLNF